MAEYIDRELLLLLIECHGTNKFGILDENIREFVSKLPAADVDPVVHGRWNAGGDYMFCSKCEMQWNYCDNDTQDFRYCPNCGAKMDSEVE